MPKLPHYRKPLEICESCKISKDVRYSSPTDEYHRATKCKDCANEQEGWRCVVQKTFCEGDGCKVRPRYYSPFLQSKESSGIHVKVSRCKLHKKPNDVALPSNECMEDGCNKTPSYADPKSAFPKSAKYCKEHAPETFKYVNRGKCKFDGCERVALMCEVNKVPANPIWCKDHVPDSINYIHVSIPRCKEKKCNNEAIYKRKGDRFAVRCLSHPPDDTENYVKKKSKQTCVKFVSKEIASTKSDEEIVVTLKPDVECETSLPTLMTHYVDKDQNESDSNSVCVQEYPTQVGIIIEHT